MWRPSLVLWTERHAAYKLLANQIAHELSGGAQSTNVGTVFAMLVAHQNGAAGQAPQADGFVDGGL